MHNVCSLNNHLCRFITLCNPVETLTVNSRHKTSLGLHIYAGSKFFVKKKQNLGEKTQNPTNQTSKKPEPVPCFLHHVCDADVGDSYSAPSVSPHFLL